MNLKLELVPAPSQPTNKAKYTFVCQLMAAINPTLSVEHILVPRELPEFIRSLVGLPNNPASLYLSVGSRSLFIYVEPVSNIRVIDLLHLNDALIQDNESALALKSLLETGTAKKVFFDARMPSKILFDRCGIELGKVQHT
jgi:hypothetical protein